MQLTRHTDYALRVLMYLSAQNKSMISVAEVAACYSISRNHLVKVVQGLTKHGFVITVRGKYGGMKLSRSANEISIGNVIRHMENNFNVVECFDRTANTCAIDTTCKLKNILQSSVENFLRELDGISLAEVINPDLRSELVNLSNN